MCVHQLFEAQVRRTPLAPAAFVQTRELTYSDLNRRANQLAAHLEERGAAREMPVAIFLDRSEEMLVALLAVLKAGSCYVPLDPSLPPDRLRWMLADSQAELVVTQSWYVPEVPAGAWRVVSLDDDHDAIIARPDDDRPRDVDPEQLAYIMYTSGSTGTPKGVEIRHAAVVNFIGSMRECPGVTAADTVMAITTLSFDISVLELFLPLAVGARLVLVGRDVATDPRQLSEAIRKQKATVIQATPATWRMLLAAGWKGRRSLKILCGGEALPASLAESLRGCCSQLWNMYGPTETTVWSTLHRVGRRPAAISIGHPIANTQVYLLDEHCRPVPFGETGELCIGGEGLARGYRGRPALTAERFIPDPFSARAGARLYRTGDLARYLPDGSLACLGRADTQVKVRGHRIELGEIEAVLARHAGVRDAIAAVYDDAAGEARLAAYIVPRETAGRPADALRRFLRESLPEYMVPSDIVSLKSLPLSSNGKVNRRALPLPHAVRDESPQSGASPRTKTERRLSAIFERVLGFAPVGIHDDVFELGVHSLTAARLFVELEREFGNRLPPESLFQAPTIEQLATLLDEGSEVSTSSLVPIQPRGHRPRLFCVHGGAGHVLIFQGLARRLGRDQPVFGLQARGWTGQGRPLTCVEDMARHYVGEIRTLQPEGPYRLAGYCFGGIVAYEMARQLRLQGQDVEAVILLNAPSPEYIREWGHESATARADETARRRDATVPDATPVLTLRARWNSAIAWRLKEVAVRLAHWRCRQYLRLGWMPRGRLREACFRMIHDRAEREYEPRPSAERLIIFHTAGLYCDSRLGWGPLVERPIETYSIPGRPCHRLTLMKDPSLRLVSRRLNDCLAE